ncbi:MAG: HAD family phosphatase [Bacteroidia bacterium]|nr:HAD family phosphatase [Bacteroidia bacterium]
MIKAIVFDMGGVMVNLDTNLCIKNFKEKAGFNAIDIYLDRFHQKGFISDLEEGIITPDEFCDKCISLSRPGTTADIIKECFCSLLVDLNQDAVKLIKGLRGRYDLFVLSNNNAITRAKFSRLMDENGISGQETFKKEFYSYEMHLLKPGREIYEQVINETGFLADEILFIDDSGTNVEGAQACGIRTLWLAPGMNIHDETMKILNNQ